ncbi:hypothetical protein KFU94_70155 [Chloroflexi bacterium TSY]|nr:hypothetical protein [Chloroflexi bacterium TSY]
MIGLTAASIGGYLTAQLAPRAGFIHAVILAAFHLALVIPLLVPDGQAPQPGWLASVAIIGSLIGGFVWHFWAGGKQSG